MKRFITLLAFALLLAIPATASGPQQPPSSDDAEELRAIQQRLMAAYIKRDREYVDRILADDWKVIDGGGNVLDKAQVLREAFDTTDRVIESAQIDEVQVRIFGDCAVVTGRTQAKGIYRGVPVSADLRFTDVFVKRKGQWQAVASQATFLPQAKPAAQSPRNLRQN